METSPQEYLGRETDSWHVLPEIKKNHEKCVFLCLFEVILILLRIRVADLPA